MEQFLQEVRALLPWLPESLIKVYADAFSESQNADQALAEVRASEDYEQFYPKNKREDGTVRLSESDYAAVKESFGLTIQDYGMNPDYFENTFATLIEKGISPNTFADSSLYNSMSFFLFIFHSLIKTLLINTSHIRIENYHISHP